MLICRADYTLTVPPASSRLLAEILPPMTAVARPYGDLCPAVADLTGRIVLSRGKLGLPGCLRSEEKIAPKL